MEKEFVLGIDGGGTATCIMACEKDGTRLREWKSGALNVNGQPHEKAAETMIRIMDQLKERGLSVKGCKGICVGAAGVSNADTSVILRKVLKDCGMEGAIKLVGDQETALAAAFEQLWGIVLIAGTGSICYGRDREGRVYRSGGCGHMIDDAGSAYAIGRDILNTVVRSVDGRGGYTLLVDSVYRKISVCSLEQLITWLYAPDRTKKDIAAFAVLAWEWAKHGDPEAVKILKNAAEELTKLADAVLRSIPEADKILLGGSVLKNNADIRRDFAAGLQKIYPDVKTVIMQENASLGAVRIIRKELGYL